MQLRDNICHLFYLHEASKSWEEAGEWKEKSMIGLGRQSRSGTYITALRNR